jgi:mannose-6-phosphate isomerase-like protein (cupin superfamily)
MAEARHAVQIENDDVRVSRWDLAVGASTGPHRHEYDYVVVPLTVGRMEITAADGERSAADLLPGRCYHRPAGVRHDVRNDGAVTLSFIEVEVMHRQES